MERGNKVKNIDEIGRVHLFNKRDYSFSIGLIPKIKKLLGIYSHYKNLQIEIQEIDERKVEVLEFKSNIFPEKLNTNKE